MDLVYCAQPLIVCADRRKSYRTVSGVPQWPSPVRIAYVGNCPGLARLPPPPGGGPILRRGALIADDARAARRRNRRKGTPLTKRLFIGNLSFNVSEDELLEAFTPFGATEVAIPVSESGRPKGFGFVTVPADQADAAIQAMDGKDLAGRTVAVNEARPREQGGGGGRGGRW